MERKRIGESTILLPSRPGIAAGAAIAGKKEGEGPLGSLFDAVVADDLFGEATWEKAEERFSYTAATTCLTKAGKTPQGVDVLLGGDLLNQIVASSVAARELQIPFLGLYGACSTMAESLCVGSMLVDGGHAENALCVASSHFCSAERQYRFPLEYGAQRTPTAQWTVTGAGAALVSGEKNLDPICRAVMVTVGRVVDLGIKDANNMGAAMAPEEGGLGPYRSVRRKKTVPTNLFDWPARLFFWGEGKCSFCSLRQEFHRAAGVEPLQQGFPSRRSRRLRSPPASWRQAA